MKRTLVISLLVTAFVVAGLLGTALLRAIPGGLPAPNPALPIHLADGTTRPLSEVLQLAHDDVPLPDEETLIVGGPDPTLTPEENAEHVRIMREIADGMQAAVRAEEGTVFHLAELARRDGRLDEAEALYLSIPEDDPSWARAQRRIAWDILSKGKGEPRRAVIYAKKALAAEPFDANSWHDFARVCAGSLGVDLH